MKVLIVEDQPEIVEVLELCLIIRWPDTTFIMLDNGPGVARTVRSELPDLVILDLGLPGMDGFEVLEDLRTFSQVPVIVVTAKSDQATKVSTLDAGADDFIVKPFAHSEFLARVNAVMRRTGSQYRSGINTDEGIVFDFASRTVSVDGQSVRLTPTEARLFSFLDNNEGKILSHISIAEHVWGSEYVDESAIKMCIRRLRLKLGDDPKSPNLIQSHRGLGYSFVRDAHPAPIS